MNSTQKISRKHSGMIVHIQQALITVKSITLFNPTIYADFHDWIFSEIYTNGDGSIQYIELFAISDGQLNLAGHTISAFDADRILGPVFTFPSNLSGSTYQSYLLLATESDVVQLFFTTQLSNFL